MHIQEAWTVSLIFFASGLALGLFFERVVLRLFQRWAKRTVWEGDDLLWHSARGLVLLWFVLAGGYFALLTAPVQTAYFSLIQKCLLILFVLSITVFTARAISGLLVLYSRQHQGLFASASIFVNLARIFIVIVGVLTIFRTLGISITPALTALGVGGLAVALALQDTLSNLFAGLQILASRQINPGDFVRLNTGEEGYINDITWRYTTMRTLSGNLIIVPNSKISTNLITNFHLPSQNILLTVSVSITPESDIQKAGEILSAAAPSVVWAGVTDNAVVFNASLEAAEYNEQSKALHAFAKVVLPRLQAAGIGVRSMQLIPTR